VQAQPVDATPSGIKLFSKVVFMKPGKREAGERDEQELNRSDGEAKNSTGYGVK
jgi:hypothetical protein